MAAATTAIIVGSLLAAGATAGTQAVLQNQKRIADERANTKREAEQRRLLDEEKKTIADQEKKRADEEAAANALDAEGKSQNAARTRQRAITATAQGRRSTLLTGPLGLTGQAQTVNKTLLGS